MSRYFTTFLFAALLVALPASAQTTRLFGGDPFSNAYHEVDRTTGAFLTNQTVSLTGFTVTGVNAMAVDPTNGVVYIIAKTGSSRQLATLNVTSGVATLIGALGDNFATLAFTTSGQLYGVTGDGATVPETMYTINKSTAAKTLFLTLGNGADGEVIAFNPSNGLMYHWSGNGTPILETINLSTFAITPITESGAPHSEVFGAIWNPTTSSFYVSDISSRLLTQTSAGFVTVIGTAAEDFRGLALVGATATVGTPTLGEWGMIALAGLLLIFAVRKMRAA